MVVTVALDITPRMRLFSSRRAVLVGDPQQLPATVLSQRARALALERSLFERLQAAGCPCRMLSEQYRMHPSIRQFPSNHFYGGRLEDGCGPPCCPGCLCNITDVRHRMHPSHPPIYLRPLLRRRLEAGCERKSPAVHDQTAMICYIHCRRHLVCK